MSPFSPPAPRAPINFGDILALLCIAIGTAGMLMAFYGLMR